MGKLYEEYIEERGNKKDDIELLCALIANDDRTIVTYPGSGFKYLQYNITLKKGAVLIVRRRLNSSDNDHTKIHMYIKRLDRICSDAPESVIFNDADGIFLYYFKKLF